MNAKTSDKILDITSSFLSEYFNNKKINNISDLRIDILDVYNECIYPESEFELDMSYELGYCDEKEILGMTCFQSKNILINSKISPPNHDARFGFTLAHEVGHAILHRDTQYSNFQCSEENNTYILEKEADKFAIELLMPSSLVRQIFNIYYPNANPIYHGPDLYTFNSKRIYVRSLLAFCKEIAHSLTHFFSASNLALAIRLLSLGCIENKTYERIDTRIKQPKLLEFYLKNLPQNLPSLVN